MTEIVGQGLVSNSVNVTLLTHVIYIYSDCILTHKDSIHLHKNVSNQLTSNTMIKQN